MCVRVRAFSVSRSFSPKTRVNLQERKLLTCRQDNKSISCFFPLLANSFSFATNNCLFGLHVVLSRYWGTWGSKTRRCSSNDIVHGRCWLWLVPRVIEASQAFAMRVSFTSLHQLRELVCEGELLNSSKGKGSQRAVKGSIGQQREARKIRSWDWAHK